MNIHVEKYIKLAMPVLEGYYKSVRLEQTNKNETPRVLKPANKIEKEYKGYISSLGASMLMSGMIPTLAFNSSRESSAKADRSMLLDWIFKTLKADPNDIYKNITNENDLFRYARGLDAPQKSKLENDIINVSIALKLCLRTFELTK